MKDALRYLMWAGSLLSDILGKVTPGSVPALRISRVDMMVSGAVVAARGGASPLALRGYAVAAIDTIETCRTCPELDQDELTRLKAALQLAGGMDLTHDTRPIADSLREEMARAEGEAEVRAACPVLMKGLAHV